MGECYPRDPDFEKAGGTLVPDGTNARVPEVVVIGREDITTIEVLKGVEVTRAVVLITVKIGETESWQITIPDPEKSQPLTLEQWFFSNLEKSLADSAARAETISIIRSRGTRVD